MYKDLMEKKIFGKNPKKITQKFFPHFSLFWLVGWKRGLSEILSKSAKKF